MNFKEIKLLDEKNCMQNYGRYNGFFKLGKGSMLYDSEGKGYIDFSSGIGVNSIGYSHPHWVSAVTEQAHKLAHVSNLFYSEPYGILCSRLTHISGMDKVFLCNSGAEANEAAIKLARKYSKDKYGEGRSTIITLKKSFHGRTMATITATGQPEYHKDFSPYLDGFKYLEANNLQELKSNISPDVCAFLIEPIQGEGGVIPLDLDYVRELEILSEEKDILLIFDEIQTGIGRTGSFLCYQSLGIMPDVVTIAKGLGGGLPIGAMLVNKKCRNVLSLGTHGSTFGGNLVACAAANAVLDVVLEDGFMEDVESKGKMLHEGIMELDFQEAKDIRGKGLMIGIQVEGLDVKMLVKLLLENGLVTLTAGADVLRLLPPLTISENEIKKGLEIMRKTLPLCFSCANI